MIQVVIRAWMNGSKTVKRWKFRRSFLRRTFPQKVKPSPSCMDEHEETMAQARQAIPETNRRVRTSAAMIGLAISMGLMACRSLVKEMRLLQQSLFKMNL